MYLPLWLALHGKLGTGDFNIAIERAGCRRTSGGARLCLWQDHAPSRGVSDGTRTRDRLDHNQELYQLSYAHRASAQSSLPAAGAPARATALRWLSRELRPVVATGDRSSGGGRALGAG